jgi:hypothetical protein
MPNSLGATSADNEVLGRFALHKNCWLRSFENIGGSMKRNLFSILLFAVVISGCGGGGGGGRPEITTGFR